MSYISEKQLAESIWLNLPPNFQYLALLTTKSRGNRFPSYRSCATSHLALSFSAMNKEF